MRISVLILILLTPISASIFKEVQRRTGSTVEAYLAVDYIREFERGVLGRVLWYGVFAVQVTDCRRKGIDSRCVDERLAPSGVLKVFLDLFVVYLFFVNVELPAKVVWLALYKRASKLSVFDDFFGLFDNFFCRCIVICLRNVDMDELIPCIDGTLTCFYFWAVVEVDVHFYAILVPVIVYHVANIFEPKRFDFTMANFYEHWGI